MDSGIQLMIQERPAGVLRLEFPGLFSARDVSRFSEALDTEWVQRRRSLNTVIFDLENIDPVLNSAGRIIDLASHFKAKCKERNVQVEMILPRDIYDDLRRVTPDKLPEKPKVPDPNRGISFRLSSTSNLRTNLQQVALAGRVLVHCKGKIREVDGRNVTVSLFIGAEEVTASAYADQFDVENLQPGQVFEYRVIARRRGVTEVAMTIIPAVSVNADEIVDLWNDIQKKLPPEDHNEGEG